MVGPVLTAVPVKDQDIHTGTTWGGHREMASARPAERPQEHQPFPHLDFRLQTGRGPAGLRCPAWSLLQWPQLLTYYLPHTKPGGALAAAEVRGRSFNKLYFFFNVSFGKCLLAKGWLLTAGSPVEPAGWPAPPKSSDSHVP